MKRLNLLLALGFFSATSVAFAAAPTKCNSIGGEYKTCVGVYSITASTFAKRTEGSIGFGIENVTVRLYECVTNTYCKNEVARSSRKSIMNSGDLITANKTAKRNRYYYSAIYAGSSLFLRSPRTYNK